MTLYAYEVPFKYLYWQDEKGINQGEFYEYYDHQVLYECGFYLNGNRHGEYKCFNFDGTLACNYFYDNGSIVMDLKDIEYSDEEKLLLTLRTCGRWLPK